MRKKFLLKALGIGSLILFPNTACSFGRQQGNKPQEIQLTPVDEETIVLQPTHYVGIGCGSLEDKKLETDPDNLQAMFQIVRTPLGSWEINIFTKVLFFESNVRELEESLTTALEKGQPIMLPSTKTFTAIVGFEDPLRHENNIAVGLISDESGILQTSRINPMNEDIFKVAIKANQDSSTVEIPEPNGSDVQLEIISESNIDRVQVPFDPRQTLPNGWDISQKNFLTGTFTSMNINPQNALTIRHNTFRCDTLQASEHEGLMLDFD